MNIEEYRNHLQQREIPEPKKKRNYEESNLHEDFCLWVKDNYPNDAFVRHEREGKRLGIMLRIHHNTHANTDKLPDFEALIYNNEYNGFYIEFKKPGRPYCTKDNKQVYSDCAAQYRTHQRLKSIGRAVWFSNDLEHAISLYIAFKNNNTLPLQNYIIPLSDEGKVGIEADTFFKERGL